MKYKIELEDYEIGAIYRSLKLYLDYFPVHAELIDLLNRFRDYNRELSDFDSLVKREAIERSEI